MHLQQLRDALHRDLNRPLVARRLNDAIDQEPSLRELRTSDAILTFLHNRHRSVGERNAVLAAILRVAQHARTPELSALLIVAFHPGLARMCSHLRVLAPRSHDGSLAMLVLESFIETVHTFRVETQAASATLGLLFGTRRAALAQLHRRKQQSARAPTPIDSHHEPPAPTADPEAALICREVGREITQVLTERVRAAGVPGLSYAAWPDLSDAMARARRTPCAARTDDERREYQRAQRARHRALRSAENVRNRLSSIRDHLPLLQQEGWQ